MTLSTEPGEHGGALRVDFRFVKGGGYAVLHRALDLDLPENYRFTFRVRGDCAPQNLEFKLIDSSGANVWWRNQRDFAFPRDWQTVTIRRRQIEFAWGPAGGGELRHVAALEIAITAGCGGRGTVWLDQLELTPLPVPGAAPPPIAATASSARRAAERRRGRGGRRAAHRLGERARVTAAPWLELDLGAAREFGGLVVDRAKALAGLRLRGRGLGRPRRLARPAHRGGRAARARPPATCPRPRRATCGCAPPAPARWR